MREAGCRFENGMTATECTGKLLAHGRRVWFGRPVKGAVRNMTQTIDLMHTHGPVGGDGRDMMCCCLAGGPRMERATTMGGPPVNLRERKAIIEI